MPIHAVQHPCGPAATNAHHHHRAPALPTRLHRREEYEARTGRPALDLVRELEQAWSLRVTPGYNPDLAFMAHLWQPVRCHWRPLAFYLGVELSALLKHCLMLAMGFSTGTVHGFTYYVYQPADRMAAQRLPVLFQHGVGVGLLPYVLFVARLACMGRPVAAVECAHLGMRCGRARRGVYSLRGERALGARWMGCGHLGMRCARQARRVPWEGVERARFWRGRDGWGAGTWA